jgi:prepilin-type N-terminal cleavage/methylation domain-containing protein
MIRSSSRRGFTLIEMITVMAVIVILVSLVLGVNTYVQKSAARNRTKAEIIAMELAVKNYEVDNASPPRDVATDEFDPRKHGAPSSGDQLELYKAACQVLYKALSGDTDLDYKPTEKSYAPDFFRVERIKFDDPKKPERKVEYIQDPFGNCYGYSTLGLTADENYRTELRKKPTAERPVDKGFNPTFDLWSTGGSNVSAPTDADRQKWVTNWGK